MTVPGSSQQAVLDHLLEHKSGATLDELVTAVGLSRTAVNQHLIALEKEGNVRKAAPRRTRGRQASVTGARSPLSPARNTQIHRLTRTSRSSPEPRPRTGAAT